MRASYDSAVTRVQYHFFRTPTHVGEHSGPLKVRGERGRLPNPLDSRDDLASLTAHGGRENPKRKSTIEFKFECEVLKLAEENCVAGFGGAQWTGRAGQLARLLAMHHSSWHQPPRAHRIQVSTNCCGVARNDSTKACSNGLPPSRFLSKASKFRR